MTSSIILGARLWPEAEVAEQRADGGGDERARQRRRPEGVGEAAPSTTVKSLAGMKERLSARGG